MCPGGTQQESRRVERSEKREGFSMQHDASPESPAQPVHRSSATKRKLFCCCRCFPYNYRSCSDAIVTDDTQRDWRSSIQHACLQKRRIKNKKRKEKRGRRPTADGLHFRCEAVTTTGQTTLS
ncbi:uncharacterized protein AB9W97_013873 isoform 4-T4 [Spinachia spinachia]